MQSNDLYKKEELVFWHNTNTDPGLNLAIEESLLDSDYTKSVPVFMLWQNSPSVIIGKHQNAFEEVDNSYLKEHGIELIRRPTGGGAVYHDLGNLNFSFIIPTSHPKVDFHIFLKPMIEALQTLGIPAEVSGRNDILAEGRKICGTAQAKGKHAILVHGSMLIDVNLDALQYVLTGNPDKYLSKGVPSVRSRVVNMREYLPKSQSTAETVSLVVQALENYFIKDEKNLHKKKSRLLVENVKDIIHLEAEKISSLKYKNPLWTYNQSPPFEATLRKKFPFGSMRVNYNVKKGVITACKLEGDFFALKDIHTLEEKMCGVDYNPNAIEEALKGIDFQLYILNADNEEIVKLFSEC